MIVVIRPEPGCSATVERGRERGLVIAAFPLFEVSPLAWEPPPAEQVDALLLGSANAVRLAGPSLDAFRGKPAFAVGATTAGAATAAGLTVAATGTHGLQPLLATIRPPRALLRLAGEEHVQLVPPLGVLIETRIVYRSAPLRMPDELAEILGAGAIVLLHSGVAAQHFASECDRRNVRRSAISLAALAPRVAEMAGGGWLAIRTASEPLEAALLALAREMCHEPSGG